MAVVNSSDLLAELESVYQGVGPRSGGIEQGHCFAFKGDWVYTFNSEVACRCRTSMPAKDISDSGFAVNAEPLIKLLKKFREEELTVYISDDKRLVFEGVKKKAGVTIEPDGIKLELEEIKPPNPKTKAKWAELSEEFNEALARVKLTASNNGAGAFAHLCVYLHPDFLQATSETHMSRYTFPTGIPEGLEPEALMIRADSVQAVFDFGVSRLAVSGSWAHFANTDGTLIVSCRMHDQEKHPFPNLDSFFELTGTEVALPKNLLEITDRAKIFSDDREGKEIKVELAPNKCRLTGESSTGFYSEWRTGKSIKYQGPPISFWTRPEMLQYVFSDFSQAYLSMDEDRSILLARSSDNKFVYLTDLSTKSTGGDK